MGPVNSAQDPQKTHGTVETQTLNTKRCIQSDTWSISDPLQSILDYPVAVNPIPNFSILILLLIDNKILFYVLKINKWNCSKIKT